MGVPQNGWLIVENPIETDDWGVPLFKETSNLAREHSRGETSCCVGEPLRWSQLRMPQHFQPKRTAEPWTDPSQVFWQLGLSGSYGSYCKPRS